MTSATTPSTTCRCLHLGHSGTVGVLPVVLDGLRSRFLRPDSVSELFA